MTPDSPSWRERLAFPTVLFAFTRVFICGVGVLGLEWEPRLQPIPGTLRQWISQYPWLDVFYRWDVGHYQYIAEHGYDELRRANFWPVYSLLTRGLMATGLRVEVSLLLITHVASWLSFLLLYRVFALIEDEQVARTGLVLFAFYPFAFFQAAAYPESLVVCLTAASVLLAMKGRHVLAGLVGGVAVATRHVALMVEAALICLRLRQRGRNWRAQLRWDLVGLALPPLGAGLFVLYLQAHFNDPLAFVTARQQFWGDGFSTFFTIPEVLRNSYLLLTALMVVCTAALFTQQRWRDLAPFAALWLGLAIQLSASGLGRHTASIWPAFLPPAYWLSKRPHALAAVVGAMACFLGLFSFLFSHHYHVL